MVAPLDTARLHLRAWTLTEADAAAFARIWADPRATWWSHALDPRESRRALARIIRHSAAMPAGLGWRAVVERGGGAVVGGVMLQPAAYADEVELGYHIDRPHWGRGFATEAAGALLAHGRDALGLDRVVAAIHPENRASRRVARKLGMRRIGEVTHEGRVHDLYLAELKSPTSHAGGAGRGASSGNK